MPRLIAGRYAVEAGLGRGGMGAVYRVSDQVGGQQLALKQLLVSGDDQHDLLAALFRREYQALSSLAHPRIVSVFDYGVDEVGPYYTMELLDGVDMRHLESVGWRRACALLRDVASSLAIMHSRRLLHRDVTPRNVRCTSDGRAKLIDFGALMPMGIVKELVGTPPYVPPEAVHGQFLDGRSDLFSLGAMAYWLLTGRHAYPAKSFEKLHESWRSNPPTPSQLDPQIPHALSSLVMSLLSLDQLTRPAMAAEVIERLTVVADLPESEDLSVARAYLATPTLVGRDRELLRFRKHISRVERLGGGAFVIEGTSGMGRSRLLASFVLEAKLAAMVVIRTSAQDSPPGEFGAARVLVSQLLEAGGEAARAAAEPHGALLAQVFEEFERAGVECSDSVRAPSRARPRRQTSMKAPPVPSEAATGSVDDPLRPRLLAALRDWFLTFARKHPLMIAVDDFERIDEATAALLATVGYEASSQRLVLAVSAEEGAVATAERALALLRSVSTGMRLRGLDADATRALLESIFGDVPNLQLLANRIDRLCEGNPRSCMELAQHLVDRGVIRYESGGWLLPSSVTDSDFPRGLTEALEDRIAQLSPEAAELSQAMSLSPGVAFSLRACLQLAPDRDPAEVYRALDELVAAQILEGDSGGYAFSQSAWPTLLKGNLSDQRQRAFHLRLAETLARRNVDAVRVAYHYLHAGDSRGVDLLLQQTRHTDPFEGVGLGFDDAVKTLELGVAMSKRQGRPRREVYELLRRLVFFGGVRRPEVYHRYAPQLLEQLRHDSGLIYLQQLPPGEPAERARRMMARAREVYDETDENERVLAPLASLGAILQFVGTGNIVGTTTYDMDLFDTLPALLEPFLPLSSMMTPVVTGLHASRDLIAGRPERCRQQYMEGLALVERMAERMGDSEQLARLRHLIVYALGLIEGALGIPSAMQRADEIAAVPRYQVSAWLMRRVAHLQQGNAQVAEQCGRQAELVSLQRHAAQDKDRSTVTAECVACANAWDLMGLKRVIGEIEIEAARKRGFRPWLHYARGEYLRFCGDLNASIAEHERAIEQGPVGRHPVWALSSAARVAAAAALGQLEQAKAWGEAAVASASEHEVSAHTIERELAVVEAQLGAHDRAVRRLERVIAEREALAVCGMPLGLHYEARAMVALEAGDDTTFQRYAQKTAAEYRSAFNPLLTARYERLVQKARLAGAEVASELDGAADPEATAVGAQTAGEQAFGLDERGDLTDRAARGLMLLVEQCGSVGGFLFVMQKEGLVCLASMGGPAPEGLSEALREYIDEDMQDADEVTKAVPDEAMESTGPTGWVSSGGQRFQPIILSARGPRDELRTIVGVAALELSTASMTRWPDPSLRARIGEALLDTGEVGSVAAR